METPEKFSCVFSKENLFTFREKGIRKFFFIFQKTKLSEFEKWNQDTHPLKMFFYFRKLNFSTPSLKNPLFLEEPLKVFHHGFHRSSFFSQTFFNLHSFPTFGTTLDVPTTRLHQPAFMKGSLGPAVQSWRFHGLHWGTKDRPGPFVCLNHSVFSQRQ